jgi:hypothetical protein
VPTRAEWQQLAEDRILDAQAQLGASRWSAAYYLVGYAVECGLKSCVLARVGLNPEVIFEVKEFSKNAWTHDIEQLVALAGVKAQRDADAGQNPALHANWQRAKDWSESSRYVQTAQLDAQLLCNPVVDINHGVMQWIRARW